MKRKARLVVLCEDKQQEVCARHFLRRCGFHPRKTEFVTCPKGKQSGEQFVRENYPSEVRACRSRKNHLSIGLAVIIDADKKTVDQRLRELEESLANDCQPIRQSGENIAIFVPKRNIETWIHYLMGDKVDEETVYSKFQKEGDCKPYIKELAEHCQTDKLSDAPLSLCRAKDECRKIKI